MVAHIATKIFFLIFVCILSIVTANSKICTCTSNYLEQPSYYDRFDRMDQRYEEDIKNVQIKKFKLTRVNLRYISENIFKGFTNLTHLRIIKSKIEDIEKNAFSHLPNLEYLDLSENKISKLLDYMFEDINKLKTLILNDNLIQSIDSLQFSNLTNLIELQIKNNQLRSIYSNTLIGLTNVEVIDLSGNPITFIQEKSFDSCKSLRRLIIENPKHIVIKSIWSSPSNFELVIVDSGNSVEDLVKDVIRKQQEIDRQSEYFKYQSSSSKMPMIITITIAVIFILALVIGISFYLKKKYNKNDKYEVATVHNDNEKEAVLATNDVIIKSRCTQCDL